MRVIVAGGRGFVPKPVDRAKLKDLLFVAGATEVVSGGASGADAFGESVARELNLPIRRFLPEWGRFGKRAGPLRNKAMAEYADAVVLFPGGRGTASMKQEAITSGLVVLYDGTSEGLSYE